MPIDLDIMDHKIFGPVMRKGMAQGIEQGEKQLLRRQMEKRFGPLPVWADQRLSQSSLAEAEELAMKVIDAKNLDELFS